MKEKQLNTLIEQHWPELAPDRREKLVQHYTLILEENEKQNLTRLTEPEAYFWQQLWDAREFCLHPELFGKRNLDLGSGSGHPGIPLAIASDVPWVLAESERRKAEFLKAAVSALGLSDRVSVHPGRAEAYLRGEKVPTVVVKAVASTAKLLALLSKCSTWNTLVLFKSGSFKEEWIESQTGVVRGHIKLEHEYAYQAADRARVLAVIRRQR